MKRKFWTQGLRENITKRSTLVNILREVLTQVL